MGPPWSAEPAGAPAPPSGQGTLAAVVLLVVIAVLALVMVVYGLVNRRP